MITGSALLGLFGIGSSSSTTSLGPSETLALYKSSIASTDKTEASIRKEPTFIRDVAALKAAIAKAKTPDDLLKDTRVAPLLLQGLGLGDQASYTGLARKALQSKLTDTKSLANVLTDTRWKTAAKTLDFAASGLTKLKDSKTLDSIIDGMVDYRRLTAISEKSQAVSDALYISTLPDTVPDVYSVLGDAVMRRVATTLAGLPDELAVLPVESQAASLKARFDVSQFGDAKKRTALIQRYLVTATQGNVTMPSYLSALSGGFSFTA